MSLLQQKEIVQSKMQKSSYRLSNLSEIFDTHYQYKKKEKILVGRDTLINIDAITYKSL